MNLRLMGLATAVLVASTASASIRLVPNAIPAHAEAPQGPAPPQVIVREIELEKPGVPIYFDETLPLTIRLRGLIREGQYRSRILRPDGERTNSFNRRPPRRLTLTDPACIARQDAAFWVFESTTVDDLRSRMQQVLDGPKTTCAGLEETVLDWMNKLHPAVMSYVEPEGSGAPLTLIIERVDAKGTVLETFEWPLLTPRIATEIEWITTKVAGRIQVLLGGPAGGERAAQITPEKVWNPDAYLSLARRFGAAAGGKSPPTYSDDILHELTAPTIEGLFALNYQVGLALRAAPGNARNHDAAALLAATIALLSPREGLIDQRPFVNLAVAHLAVARAVSVHSSVEGEMARVALDLVLGRQRRAAAKLQVLRSSYRAPAALAWNRALRMRATGDWRIYEEATSPTLLEQLEEARALARAWSSERASAFGFGQGTLSPDALWWGHAILRPANPVEVGNAWALPQFRAAEKLKATLQSIDQPTIAWLAADAAGSQHAPISLSLWRAFSEQALADAAWKLHRSLEAAADNARGFASFFETQTGDSLLTKILGARWQLKSGPAVCQDIRKALREDEFAINVRAHDLATASCPDAPPLQRRIDPWMPPGTVFDIENRSLAGIDNASPGVNWRALGTLTFYEPYLFAFLIDKVEKRPRVASDYRAFSRESSFNLTLLRRWRDDLATLADFANALEPAQTACRLEALECNALSDLLRVEDRTDEAFAAARRVFPADEALTVAQAEESGWLIAELLRRGDIPAARDLARRAAKTESSYGVQVLARLHERLGEMSEAERLYAWVDARYNDLTVTEWRIRRLARGGAASREEIQLELSKFGEPRKFDLEPEKANGESAIGAAILLADLGPERFAQGRKMGLPDASLVVGVNGYRVENEAQLWLALSFDDEPVATFRVKTRGKPERDIKGRFWKADYFPIPSR